MDGNANARDNTLSPSGLLRSGFRISSFARFSLRMQFRNVKHLLQNSSSNCPSFLTKPICSGH